MRILKRFHLFLAGSVITLNFFVFGIFPAYGGDKYSILRVGISGKFDKEKEVSDEDQSLISVGELYLYNEENAREALKLAPKIIVQFPLSSTLPEKQEEFLSESLSGFPNHEYVQELAGNRPTNRWLIKFEENTPSATIVDVVNRINKPHHIAHAFFVFLIHGIEAEMTGMTIEPKEFFSASDLQRHVVNELKKYGDFTIGAFTVSRDGLFHISFSEIRPPLTLLRLVNLAHTDSWVRRAYPEFRYLHPAVTAELKVIPETGQLDEVRTVSLTIQNFTPEQIRVDPQLVSPLGSAEFIPKHSSGSKARYFEVSPEPDIHRELNARGEVITFKWKLHLFEVRATGPDSIGRWSLPGPPVNFINNGELKSITTNTANFFVISHLAGIVTSFPPATPLMIPEISVTQYSSSFFTLSPSWLDSVPLEPALFLYASFILAGISGIASFMRGRALLQQNPVLHPPISFRRGLPKGKKRVSGEPSEKSWQELCTNLLHEAQQLSSTESYQKIQTALFLALKNIFPGESGSYPELDEIIKNLGNRLNEKERQFLATISVELERIYMPNFVLKEEALAKLISEVQSFVVSLERSKKEFTHD